MKAWSALLSLTTVLSQNVEEATYLLQVGNMEKLQHKGEEIEDCYVTGGCKTTTTTTTAAPTTTTTLSSTTTTTTAKRTRPTRPTTTTTTAKRTRPTRPPVTTTTTSTTTMEVPEFGEVVVDKPPGGETDQPKYCGPKSAEFKNENLIHATVNNLGYMGPGGKGTGRWAGKPVIAYECGIELHDGKCVDVVISAVGKEYYTAHTGRAKFTYERKFGRKAKEFIEAYNGDKRANVIGIGALVPGAYKFKFSFYDENMKPVEIDYLPMTFYDLDGKNDLKGDTRYEVASTEDAEGLVAFAHPTLHGVDNLKHQCKGKTCWVESVTQEVKIPSSFDTLSDDEKSAAATFLFAHKSSVEITYKLNFGHRVFLFKGSKSLYCAEKEEAKTTSKPKSRSKKFGDKFKRFR